MTTTSAGLYGQPSAQRLPSWQTPPFPPSRRAAGSGALPSFLMKDRTIPHLPRSAADWRRPAQNQPLSVEIKPSRFDGKRLPIINLHWPSRLLRRRSNIEPPPFKPGPSPSKLRRPLSNGLAPLFNIRGRSVKSGERPSKCRRPPANLPPRLSIGPARPAKLRPAPAKYLGRLTDGRASLPECRFWSSVDRRPLLDYRRSSFVGGASPKNCRPASFVRQRRLFECRRSMFKVRSR